LISGRKSRDFPENPALQASGKLPQNSTTKAKATITPVHHVLCKSKNNQKLQNGHRNSNFNSCGPKNRVRNFKSNRIEKFPKVFTTRNRDQTPFFYKHIRQAVEC